MGKTFRRGDNGRGYYSPGKSIRDKRQKGGTNRSTWADDSNYDDYTKTNKKRKFDSERDNDTGWY